MNVTLSDTELPVRLRFDRPLSDDELMRFCAVNDPLRIEREPNGELLVMTPSGFGSGMLNSRIVRLLDEWAEEDGRGVVTDSNGGYTLPDGSVRAPDAAWVASSKLQGLSEEQKTGFAPVTPGFIIELRSASDKLPELERKMEMWIANGVELGWLLDPSEKTVTIYRPGAAPERHFDPTSVQGTGPVAGFELVLARIWQ